MKGTWIKKFADGSREYGNDTAIALGKASWSKGRLDGIEEVILVDGIRMGTLSVDNTVWHQFDKMEVPLASGQHQPVRTHRVVQAKLTPEHVGKYVLFRAAHRIITCSFYEEDPPEAKMSPGSFMKINKDEVGRWLTLVLPAKGTAMVLVTEKGKII